MISNEVTAGALRADSFDLIAMEVSMATVMAMHWPEMTRQQYDQVRQELNLEANAPQGATLHVAWFAQDGLHVLDVWESQAKFETFLQRRLTPAIEKLGVKGKPRVEFAQAHAIFPPNIPAPTATESSGASRGPRM
jgi:hypothetical protein